MNKNYKKMLKVMMEKEEKVLSRLRKKARRKSRQLESPWFLYILRCSDGTLYTGVTKDIERRTKMHNDGKGASYTRMRRPVTLLYQEKCQSRTQALVRECEIKSYPREKKLALACTCVDARV